MSLIRLPPIQPIDTLIPGGTGGSPLDTRVELILFASNKAFDFQLQRALGNGAFSIIATINGSLFNSVKRFDFTDFDVNDGQLYRYRGRHVRSDALDGVLSTPVTALAQLAYEEDTGGTDGTGGTGGSGGGDDSDELFLFAFSPNFGDTLL